MSNQTKTINLRNGGSLTASVNGQNIELSSSGGTNEIIPPRQPSASVEQLFQRTDPGGFLGQVAIRDLKEGSDGSIALAYSDNESANNFIVCLCDKRVNEEWQVCEDPITKLNSTLTNVGITEQPDNTHSTGWIFLMTATGTEANGDPFREQRGH